MQGVLYAPFNPAFGSQYELPVTALEACDREIEPDLERRSLGFRTRVDQSAYVTEYAGFLDAVLAETSLPRFIASSEHIHAWLTTPELIAALDGFLQGRFSQVEYLVYLRPQEELVTSAYSEAIRRGARHDFATHLARHGRINHWTALKRWLEVIGRDRIRVRLMARDALAGQDLIEDFCRVSGIESAGLGRPPRVNAALTRGEIALRRRLNTMLPVQSRSGRVHPLYALSLRLLRPFYADDRHLRLSAEQMTALQACNFESNEKLRKRLFHHRSALF